MKLSEDLRQREIRKRTAGADGDTAPLTIRVRAYLAGGGSGVFEDPLGPDGQGEAGLGRGNPPVGAVEEADAQLALEGCNLLGERGLGDAQVLGSSREAPPGGYGDDITELPKVHDMRII